MLERYNQVCQTGTPDLPTTKRYINELWTPSGQQLKNTNAVRHLKSKPLFLYVPLPLNKD